MIRLAIGGVGGRMGSLIAALALQDKRFRVVGALESPGHPWLGQDLGPSLGRATTQVVVTDEAASALAEADVLVEFTAPEATVAHATVAAQHQVAMVIGTTGLSTAQMQQLRRAAVRIPLFWSANMALGVYVLRRALREAAYVLQACGLAAEAQIVLAETHHVHKKDMPSGTAKQLQSDLAQALQRDLAKMPIASTREGEVVGIHHVQMTLGDETLSFSHTAASRAIFARGALVVAAFLAAPGRRPGWYDMDAFVAGTTKRPAR